MRYSSKAKMHSLAPDEEIKGISAIECGIAVGLLTTFIVIAVTGMGGDVAHLVVDICNAIGGQGSCH